MRRLAAEAIGTFLLVLGATAPSLWARSLYLDAVAAGAVVAAVVAVLGSVSGAHINPAVTIALAARGRFAWRAVPGYVAAQVIGAVTGGLLYQQAKGSASPAGLTIVRAGLHPAWATAAETAATACLLWVIVRSTRLGRGRQALAIGAAVAVGILWAGTLTGGSMNPARSLGPWLASGLAGWWAPHVWLYVVGPVLGGLGGAALATWPRPRPTPPLEEAVA